MASTTELDQTPLLFRKRARVVRRGLGPLLQNFEVALEDVLYNFSP